MGISVKVSTRDLDGPAFGDYVVWCYKIRNPAGFKRNERLGIDLPGDTYVMPPHEASQIEGAPGYDLDGKGTGPAGRVTQDGQQEVEICFVGRRGPARRGELSLEIRRPRAINDNHYVLDDWERLPFESGEEGIGPHWVPPAMASLGTASADKALMAMAAIQRRFVSPHGKAEEA